MLPGSESVATDDLSPDPDPLGWPDYADRRELMRERTGRDESIVVREGVVAGGSTRTVAIVWEFGFLGGSMGSAAGQRIAAGYDHARRRGLPVLLLPATGGARMQEGMASLVQMAATTVAATAHRDAGLLQVAVLQSPTTGGPFASHVNLADVLLAEPGATIGFAGPRVARALGDGTLPDGSHTAEGARTHGLVDDVVARPDLPARLERLLGWTRPDPPADGLARPRRPERERVDVDAWDAVLAARAPDRPRAPAFLDVLEDRTELAGDRAGGRDPSVRVILGRLRGRCLVVVAMDTTSDVAVTTAGYRTAWRGIELAARLGVPLVTLVDTPGADASAASEAAGIASHIARTFAMLLSLTTPTVALVIGQGGSGGALALAVCDRLLIQERAIFSVIAPEGAASILRRNDVDDVSRLLDPTSQRLHDLGIADEVVPEDDDPVGTAWTVVLAHLDDLAARPAALLRDERLDRWRRTGTTP